MRTDPDRKLAERLRKYESGVMVDGADLGRAAAYLDYQGNEIERLREAVDVLLEVARDVVSDGQGTINPGLVELAQKAIALAERARQGRE